MKKWQDILQTNFRKIDDLASFLNLDINSRAFLEKMSDFPLNLPRRLASKIAKNNLNDPLFLQFVPIQKENIKAVGFSKDAVLDLVYQKTPKMIHKYGGRVLLTTSGACAMHCRYCFRRHFPYEKESGFTKEIEAIANDPSIFEVILSGGDPLSLPTPTLRRLIKSLEAIPHLKLLRFHTRFPIGIPERIDDELLELFREAQLQIFFVIHINHERELDDDILEALKKVRSLGIPVLTQTVLLHGVNDSFETLFDLFKRLASEGIVPYQLHQLDRVEGAAHFEVAYERGLALYKALEAALPGYALPRWVQDIPGRPSKSALTSSLAFLDQESKAP